MSKGGCTRTTSAAAAATALVLACCGGAAPAGSPVRSARCTAAVIHHGPAPAWTSGAWADSSPGSSVPYAVAAGDRAAAFFFADPLRAGHPANPANKVLWVVRLPRHGMPLTIAARRAGSRLPAVRISRPADSGPGEIYPSYVDLPQAGCWRLALAWGGHRASIDVQVAPAGVKPASAGSRPAAVAARRARARAPVPLHGVSLARRTGLRLLVSADPPFVLNVDSGRVTPVTGVNIRGDPVLTVQAVGRDAVLWAEGRSARKPPVVYVVRHGGTRAIRIGTGSAVAPADRGHALWLVQARGAHRCVLKEVALSGETIRRPRRIACGSQLVAAGAVAAVLVDGRRVIAPDSGRLLLRARWLWAIAGGHALTSAGSGPPLRLVPLGGGAGRRLRWPSRIRFTDEAVTAPGGRLLALDFGDPAYRLGSTQVTDAWLLDPVSGRFDHLPDMPAAVYLKFTSMAWASGRRLVILAGPDTPSAGRGRVVVWRAGRRQLALRSIHLPARNSGSDAFVVW